LGFTGIYWDLMGFIRIYDGYPLVIKRGNGKPTRKTMIFPVTNIHWVPGFSHKKRLQPSELVISMDF
jgi:hypothetical protein